MRTITANNLHAIVEAIKHLRTARSLLRSAGAVKAANYTAQCLKSAEGADRHAYLLYTRQNIQKEQKNNA